MNGRVFRIDIPAHQAVQELLPWYASSQLAPDEARRVHEHLQNCAQCRQDLEWEHGMRVEASAAGLPEGVDMAAALARLMPALGPQERVELAASAVAAPSPWWRRTAANQPSWLRWAVAAQWVVIAGLGALLLRPAATPDAYRVLGSGPATTGNLVVVFHPNISERELRRVLQAQNARLVDGPTVTDAYLLSVPAASRAQALQALRADAAVKLAEPLDGGGTP
jgi:hypothetical protein